jgi:hypothetical protein
MTAKVKGWIFLVAACATPARPKKLFGAGANVPATRVAAVAFMDMPRKFLLEILSTAESLLLRAVRALMLSIHCCVASPSSVTVRVRLRVRKNVMAIPAGSSLFLVSRAAVFWNMSKTRSKPYSRL